MSPVVVLVHLLEAESSKPLCCVHLPVDRPAWVPCPVGLLRPEVPVCLEALPLVRRGHAASHTPSFTDRALICR